MAIHQIQPEGVQLADNASVGFIKQVQINNLVLLMHTYYTGSGQDRMESGRYGLRAMHLMMMQHGIVTTKLL